MQAEPRQQDYQEAATEGTDQSKPSQVAARHSGTERIKRDRLTWTVRLRGPWLFGVHFVVEQGGHKRRATFTIGGLWRRYRHR
jgi:hypothetical protein